ncbi:hypothetical protein [Lacrimispora sp.]|uniref:hypothetical protein n=1 Tax=Lacrimispora sp. TaxID=2719234 RepID=UPI0028B1153E|nr:hypothetical protein [Lacrimispora sp.]
MNTENIFIASEVVEISESNTYLELTSRICYYDDTNANGVLLPSDGAEDKSQTLVNMPVQAKYRTNIVGLPTFSGHEMSKDQNGNISFGTQSIGTHTEVYIENANVDVRGVIKNLPCLYAKYRIWKRYENVVAAVRRLFSIGKLFGSWEIVISSYEYKDGIKTVADYEFLANTLLGYEYAKPSYGVDAKALSLSTDMSDGLMVAEALSQDIISHGLDKENKAKEDNNLQKKNVTQVAENNAEGAIEKTPVATLNTTNNDTTEISQLTEYDLRKKIREACRARLDKWCWISFHFPVEKEVWLEVDDRESELDFVRMTYEVNNDTITVSDPENVKLTVSISEINTKVAELESEISTKDDAIIQSGEEISKLKAEVSTLTPFKEKFEKDEQEKVAAELQEKKDTLVSSVTKSGLITKEEIESSEELKGYVDTLDDKSLKAILAERYMESLNGKETLVSENLHTDEIKTATASVNLNNLEDEQLDVKSIMKSYLGN